MLYWNSDPDTQNPNILAWGHPQWFVWRGIACPGETRKYSFPHCLSYGIPNLSKVPEKPSGLGCTLDFPPCHVLPWNSGQNLKSLCDSCAKAGTYLQIITVCPKMHSTLSEKYKTSCVWDLLPNSYCFVFLSWLENWPLRNSDKYTVKKKKNTMLMEVLTKQNLSIYITSRNL